jgi:hypothetical protein
MRHQRHAAGGDLLRREPADALAEDLHGAAARRQQADGRRHAGRLAGAVAAQQAEQVAFGQ